METFEIELGRQSIDMGGTRTIEQGEPTTELQSTLQEQGLAANKCPPPYSITFPLGIVRSGYEKYR